MFFWGLVNLIIKVGDGEPRESDDLMSFFRPRDGIGRGFGFEKGVTALSGDYFKLGPLIK